MLCTVFFYLFIYVVSHTHIHTFVYFDPFSSILNAICFGTNCIFVSMLNLVVTPCVMLITFACLAECSSTFTKSFLRTVLFFACIYTRAHTDTWILGHTRTHTNISTHTPHRNRLAHHAGTHTCTHKHAYKPSHARTHTHMRATCTQSQADAYIAWYAPCTHTYQHHHQQYHHDVHTYTCAWLRVCVHAWCVCVWCQNWNTHISTKMMTKIYQTFISSAVHHLIVSRQQQQWFYTTMLKKVFNMQTTDC